jgi:hypothetical protein
MQEQLDCRGEFLGQLQARIGEPAQHGAEVEMVDRDGERCRIEVVADPPRRPPAPDQPIEGVGNVAQLLAVARRRGLCALIGIDFARTPVAPMRHDALLEMDDALVACRLRHKESSGDFRFNVTATRHRSHPARWRRSQVRNLQLRIDPIGKIIPIQISVK